MMERILQQQQLLCATLIEICRSDLMPTDAEISNMEGFVEAMRPFAEQVVKSDLEDCYSDPHLMMLVNKACFLHPCFKSLSFLSDEDKKSVLLSVEEEVAHIKTKMVSSKGESPVDGPEPSKKKAKQESKFLSLLEDVLDKLDTMHADIS